MEYRECETGVKITLYEWIVSVYGRRLKVAQWIKQVQKDTFYFHFEAERRLE